MLRECYEALRNITEAMCIVTGCYGTLHSVAGRYRTLRKCYAGCKAIRNITEHCVLLWDVTEASWIVTELLWKFTELLQKILILPVTN